MNRRTSSIAAGLLLVTGVAAVCSTPAALAAGPPKVSVRVEGLSSTLLSPRKVQVGTGFVTKGGAPTGKCSDSSAQGALDAATHGDWKGSWDSSYGDYFDTRILGTTEGGSKDYWELFVNDVAAKAGFCQTGLRSGDELLIAAVPSKGKPLEPISIQVLGAPRAGKPLRIQVYGHNSRGVARPLAGATVTYGSTKLTSGGDGMVSTVSPRHSGTLTVHASKSGYIRDEQTVVVGS